MKINHVHAVYFSPTGNAKKVVTTLAQAIADTLGVPMDSYDFTLPESREKVHTYGADDLLVIGTPVYAGRIPNKMLPFVQTHFEGNGALAIPVAVFGNRNFDNGLIELRNELEAHGFHTIAGAGIPTEHVFSDKLATGRPDADDLAQIHAFGIKAAEKVASLTEIPAPIAVRGGMLSPPDGQRQDQNLQDKRGRLRQLQKKDHWHSGRHSGYRFREVQALFPS